MVNPVQRRTAKSFAAGLVVFVLIAALLFLTFKAQSGLPFRQTTLVKAEVANVHALKVSDDVRVNSVRVGRVSELAAGDNDNAVVTLEIDGDVPVYRDAQTQVWDISALATKFVELDPGTEAAGRLGDAPIPAAQSKSSADLYQVLDVLEPNTRNAATAAVRELGGGFAGHSDDLSDFLQTAPAMLDDLGAVSGVLAAPDTDLPALLNSADRVAGRLADREAELSSLLRNADATLRAVTTDHSRPLQETLDQAPDTLRAVRPALDALNQPLADTRMTMATLEPGAHALGEATPDLRGFLVESVPVAEDVPPVAEQAVPAVEELTRTAADARPLAPRAVETLNSLVSPLQVLAPYGPEIGQLFVRGASFLSEGPEPGTRFARLGLAPGLGTATGMLPSPNFTKNEYPAPGENIGQRKTDGLPAGVPLVPDPADGDAPTDQGEN